MRMVAPSGVFSARIVWSAVRSCPCGSVGGMGPNLGLGGSVPPQGPLEMGQQLLHAAVLEDDRVVVDVLERHQLGQRAAATVEHQAPELRGHDAGAPIREIEYPVQAIHFGDKITVYLPPDGPTVETANEIRLPVGRTVSFSLASSDVLHSFWIPGLAGKVDMIPGRRNRLVVHVTQAGTYRGVCAEFCGLSHARMAFDVIAMPPADFDQWLANVASPATAVGGSGRQLFEDYGCNGCHAVRGHFPTSPIGPDLTHFGSRLSLAAGTLPVTVTTLKNFIRNPALTKPGALMPAFESMSTEDADAIAIYLMELK